VKLKRLAAPRWWPIERKTKRFIVGPRGPNKLELSLPLLVLIRDVLKLAETGNEAKVIINSGKVFVDKKINKDIKFGIGVLNVIEIPELKKVWRAIPKKGLSFIEVPKGESDKKIVKIIDKKILKKGKTQLNLSDGRNILTNKKFKTNDSLLINLPDQKILKHLEFKKGSVVLVFSGKTSGKIAKIKKIEPKRVWLDDDKEVPINKIIVIGEKKPEIKCD
jgi:small subunit ribosomal protein S4e